MRAAALLTHLQDADIQVDRSGLTGQVAEVYPQAAVERWSLTTASYKKAHLTDEREAMIRIIEDAMGGDFFHIHRDGCRISDDSLDAVICALVAKAAHDGAVGPPPDDVAQAQREGWICAPTGSLSELLHS